MPKQPKKIKKKKKCPTIFDIADFVRSQGDCFICGEFKKKPNL